VSTSQFIVSGCCQAPVTLDYAAYAYMTDTVTVRCANCHGELGGAAIEALPEDARQKVFAARWDVQMGSIKLETLYALTALCEFPSKVSEVLRKFYVL